MTDLHPELDGLGTYEYGWHDPDVAGAAAQRGLSEAVVRDISRLKNEPEWMLDLRLKGLRLFDRKPMPAWGSDLSGIDFDTIKYFVRSTEKQATTWDELPSDIKNTYDRLGIPEAEKQRLVAGVAAQYESEVVYHQINEELERQGVIFCDMDTALREHPELETKYREDYDYYPRHWVEPYLGRRRQNGWSLYGLLGISTAAVRASTRSRPDSMLRQQVQAWWLIFPVLTAGLWVYPMGSTGLVWLICALAARELSSHWPGPRAPPRPPPGSRPDRRGRRLLGVRHRCASIARRVRTPSTAGSRSGRGGRRTWQSGRKPSLDFTPVWSKD